MREFTSLKDVLLTSYVSYQADMQQFTGESICIVESNMIASNLCSVAVCIVLHDLRRYWHYMSECYGSALISVN